MARPSEEFLLAWSSLSSNASTPGWQAISLPSAGPVKVQAGRRSQTNVEAILLSFPTAKLPLIEKLPEGQGFLVERIDSTNTTGLRLALTRQAAGRAELFAAMACDVVGAIDDAAAAGSGEAQLLRAFIRRVVAWQHFMSRGTQPLGPEAELGLAGELTFIACLLQAGVSAETILEGWVGPEDASKDFALGHGAIEIKATLSTAGFPVKIGSLEQLDDATISPLFLGALRFSLSSNGSTLPKIVLDIERQLAGIPAAVALAREKLLAAGYVESHASTYLRTFELKEVRVYEITEGFPRLTTGQVPYGVFRATYEINLDHAKDYLSNLPAALRDLGVLQ